MPFSELNDPSRTLAIRLHLAIIFKNFNEVIKIVDSGANLNYFWKGRTPVSSALYEKVFNILEYLVRKGADVNICSKDNYMEPPLFGACRLGRLEAVHIILKSSQVDINQRDFYNRTPLWAATRASSLEIVKLLLDQGADVNAASDCTECPLSQSFLIRRRTARMNIARLLICRGCKLDTETKDQYIPPLCWSVKRGDKEMFSLLVNAGCKIKKSDWLAKDQLPVDWQKDEQFCQWINSLQNEPRTLTHLALYVIRQSLNQSRKNILPTEVKTLFLPNHLKRLILFEE